MARTIAPDPATIAKAARRLERGLLVAFPTETVYGLGCDPAREAAVAEVFRLKGRPSDNPLIVHVLDAAMARQVVPAWDDRAERLARVFWPGPLTIVLPRGARISAAVAGGGDTVAVRAPDHPVARALLRAFGAPLAAPSANRSGRISPTTAEHVAAEFSDVEDLPVLDGGPCRVGLESTVVDLTGAHPVILRPGAVTAADLEPILGPVASPRLERQGSSPGTRASHYAPTTPAASVGESALARALAGERDPVAVLARSGIAVVAPHRAFHLPPDDAGFARELYARLREADMAGTARILIALPDEEGGAWDAIHDRVRRAVAPRG